jgi:hypothetical protein
MHICPQSYKNQGDGVGRLLSGPLLIPHKLLTSPFPQKTIKVPSPSALLEHLPSKSHSYRAIAVGQQRAKEASLREIHKERLLKDEAQPKAFYVRNSALCPLLRQILRRDTRFSRECEDGPYSQADNSHTLF